MSALEGYERRGPAILDEGSYGLAAEYTSFNRPVREPLLPSRPGTGPEIRSSPTLASLDLRDSSVHALMPKHEAVEQTRRRSGR